MVGSTAEQKAIQTKLVRGTINGSLGKDMVLGPFIVAYAVQVQGFTNAELSWFLSVIPLIVLLRFPFLDLIRGIPRITVLHWARWVQASCLIALLVLPTPWITLPVLFAIAAWFVFGNEFLQNAVWMNLVAEVSHRRDRGRFLGKLRTWKQAANMSFALFGFVLVGDALSGGEFNVLLVIVLALLLNSMFWYRQIHETPPPDSVRDYAGKGQLWHIMRTHPLLRRPLGLAFINAVLHWPILIVYIVGSLHLPANLLMLTIVASMTGSIVSEQVWGTKTDSHGIRTVFVWYFVGSLLLYPMLLFVPDYGAIETDSLTWYVGTAVLLAFYFLRGVLDAGQLMAASIYRAFFINEGGGFHAVNLLTAINQIIGSALTALGGILLVSYATPQVARLGPLWVDPFRLLTIAIMLITILAGLWLAMGIRTDDGPQRTSSGDGVL